MLGSVFQEDQPMPFHPSPAGVARATGCALADDSSALRPIYDARAWQKINDLPVVIAVRATVTSGSISYFYSSIGGLSSHGPKVAPAARRNRCAAARAALIPFGPFDGHWSTVHFRVIRG